MNEPHYDIAIIGSGPGGYRAAILAALQGQRVAIIERADWGGCCLNRGCVPKKDWHHTARLIAASQQPDRGITGVLKGDLNAAWAHQKSVVTLIQESYVDYMKRLKITTLTGHARFADPQTLTVTPPDAAPTSLTARAFIIATGGQAQVPEPFTPIPGKVLTSDMLFDHPPPPGARVALIGSGVIATEFAFIFHLLGKQVSWLARSEPLHRIPFSHQARTVLRDALDRQGIRPQRVGEIIAVEVQADAVCLMPDQGDPITVDWVCLGTGRRPYTEGLGLKAAGITCTAQGFIQRNAQLQTSQSHIYAIGDVASPDMTANHALADATVAIHNILHGPSRAQDPNRIPLAVYSAVELARIGLDEEAAEDEGFEPAVGFAAFETSPRALGQDDAEGFVRLIADLDTGAFLGGEIIGSEAGELIHLLSLAPDPDSALRWLANGRYNHPSRAEELANATETLASKWGLGGILR